MVDEVHELTHSLHKMRSYQCSDDSIQNGGESCENNKKLFSIIAFLSIRLTFRVAKNDLIPEKKSINGIGKPSFYVFLFNI